MNENVELNVLIQLGATRRAILCYTRYGEAEGSYVSRALKFDFREEPKMYDEFTALLEDRVREAIKSIIDDIDDITAKVALMKELSDGLEAIPA